MMGPQYCFFVIIVTFGISLAFTTPSHGGCFEFMVAFAVTIINLATKISQYLVNCSWTQACPLCLDYFFPRLACGISSLPHGCPRPLLPILWAIKVIQTSLSALLSCPTSLELDFEFSPPSTQSLLPRALLLGSLLGVQSCWLVVVVVVVGQRLLLLSGSLDWPWWFLWLAMKTKIKKMKMTKLMRFRLILASP